MRQKQKKNKYWIYIVVMIMLIRTLAVNTFYLEHASTFRHQTPHIMLQVFFLQPHSFESLLHRLSVIFIIFLLDCR